MPLLVEQENFHRDTTILTGIGESFSRQLQFDPLVSKVAEQIGVDLVHSADREEANTNQNCDQEAKRQAQLCPDVVGHHVFPHHWLRRYVQATSGHRRCRRRCPGFCRPIHRSGAFPEMECGSAAAGRRQLSAITKGQRIKSTALCNCGRCPAHLLPTDY